MNSTLKEILTAREDLSAYAYHFTKGAHAFKTLKDILKEGMIKDVNQNGFICFSEMPLTATPKMFEIFDRYSQPMYAPYGIAIKKKRLFGLGGRHVIYGPEEERFLIDKGIRWRFEEYEPGLNDYSWLREWRVPVDKVEIGRDNCFVITRSIDEQLDVVINPNEVPEIYIDGCVSDGMFVGSAIGEYERLFKVVSIDEIRTLNQRSKEELEQIINDQNDTEININLGHL